MWCIWLNVSINQVEGEIDETCKVDCACCIDKKCGIGQWSSTDCTLGCIDGYRGGRCYLKCRHNCTKCADHVDTCTACYDGYYLGPAKDCTSRCLPGCKTCTSGNTCTSCKEGYNNDNGRNDCSNRYCPEHCYCDNGKCLSCKDGYHDISNLCDSLCPVNCVTCLSNTKCGSCKDGYYNGHQYDNNNLPLLNNCKYKCRDNCSRCTSYNSCSLCKSGLYGANCDNNCSVGCMSNACNILTGYCTCLSNFAGERCDQCKNRKYGNMCDQECPAGCKGHVCKKDSGDCTDGCIEDTIVGGKCDVCLTGWYGEYCNISCSVGCKNQQCEKSNGECSKGCLDNFAGGQCKQCMQGKYGDSCNKECPNNCDDKGCLTESGNCINCNDNFNGEKCDRCRLGFYGSLCSERCPTKCLNNVCERDNGTCSDGCVDNYSGDRCCINNNNCITCLLDTRCKECKKGYFNDQCDKRCPKNCLKSCHIESGFCDGCKENFYGDSCNISCAFTCKIQTTTSGSICQQSNGKCLYGCVDSFHGLQCSENCSVYCSDTLCDQDDGKCTKGCKTRVKDDTICSLDSESQQGEDKGNQDSLIGPIVGGIVGILVATTVIVGVIIFCRRRQGNKGQGQRSDLENTQSIKEDEKKHTYGNISERPSSKEDKERKSALSIPPTTAVNTQPSGNKPKSPPPVASSSVDIDEVEVDEVKYENKTDDTYYNIKESPYRIKVDNLLKYVTSGKVDFEAEFKKLNKDLDLTKYCSVAKDPQNLALNRYNGIYPYDHSRVTIQDLPDFFINACYIDGYCKENEYIASLGPTSKTTANFSTFWLMVWYKKTDIVVMLTNLRETSGMKCEQYWPEEDTEIEYGDITVKCRSVEAFAEYTVRTCTIVKGKQERQIIQLHFTAWPDKGVPQEVTSLVEFRQRVNAVPKTLGGPIIVHCRYCIMFISGNITNKLSVFASRDVPMENPVHKIRSKPIYYGIKNLGGMVFSLQDQKKSMFHFQYKNWQTAKKVPDSAMDFVQFVKEVEKYVANDPEDDPNIIAHCLNGFERSGLFCVVYKLLEKLEAERQVSVVNVVRKIRTHRPQSITSMEQLKFCYECVSAYLEIYNTYSNFAS
ncbi:cell death abnormality protein 1-like [Ruditapes philippinarum]|uniref:cell death abnormality protein 1-like n=1 Tax=Ruditapes philippinarum TaxID=129788 RepID=UPI00295AFC43|nr:cell death abnormality protein 1-like [Ruditapes philippinarum]